jgi:molybdopterin synthase catalytic subunit
VKVRVLMFGALAEAAAKRDAFDLPTDATAGEVVAAVGERYPVAVAILERCAVAVNHEVVGSSHRVGGSDEIALLPPMSGGGAISVRLTASPSVSEALDAVAAAGSGGTALFVGTVRDSSNAGPVTQLDYSAYDAMAEKVIGEIAGEAVGKWGLLAVAVEHATGPRCVGEITFVVACAAPHRDEAFDACRYVVDEVKRRAPVWKKESGPWGERWVGL